MIKHNYKNKLLNKVIEYKLFELFIKRNGWFNQMKWTRERIPGLGAWEREGALPKDSAQS